MTAHPIAPMPPEESGRIEALFHSQALTVDDERLRPITSFARDAFRVAMAHISLIDTDSQWFCAPVGLAAQSCARTDSFCGHVVARGDAVIVNDAWQDPGFAQNPFVTGAPFVRFYAGVPLRGPNGHVLGTLCVLDTVPRDFDRLDEEQLERLAALAADILADGRGPRPESPARPADPHRMRETVATVIDNAQTSAREAAIMRIAIDGFRDTLLAHGATYANALLAAVEARLSNAFGPGTSVGRYGADSFLAVKLLGRDEVDLPTFAEPARVALDTPFEVAGQSASLAARIGIGLFPRDGADGAAVIDAAEQALAQGPPSAGQTINAFDPDLALKLDRDFAIERRLRAALAGMTTERPGMVYQPRVVAARGTVIGAEALMRWQDAELGPVPPSDFIPIAEYSGLINPLGLQGLAEACRTAAAWPVPDTGPAPVLAVNVAAAQLTSPSFAAALREVLETSGLPPERLVLEMAETALIKAFEPIQAAMRDLATLGLRFAIDNFGTGHASFSDVGALPVDQITIDRTVVQAMDQASGDSGLVKALIAMGHALDLQVVATGVETRAQFDALAALGCDAVQGFLIAPALDRAECGRFVGHAIDA